METGLPRRPEAVIFDLDGTLLDSERLLIEGHTAAAAKLGVPMDAARLGAMVGQSRASNDASLRGWLGAVSLDDYRAELTSILADRVAALKPGALELLDHLDALGLPYALATSAGPPWVERHFTAHGLHRRFRATVTRADVRFHKPHPEPYRVAAARLGYAPQHVLALEDSPAGLRSAYEAGTMAVLVPDLLEPDAASRACALRVVGSLHEVLAMLGGR